MHESDNRTHPSLTNKEASTYAGVPLCVCVYVIPLCCSIIRLPASPFFRPAFCICLLCSTVLSFSLRVFISISLSLYVYTSISKKIKRIALCVKKLLFSSSLLINCARFVLGTRAGCYLLLPDDSYQQSSRNQKDSMNS